MFSKRSIPYSIPHDIFTANREQRGALFNISSHKLPGTFRFLVRSRRGAITP